MTSTSDASGVTGSQNSYTNSNEQEVTAIQSWFARHVTLFGQPYTLDFDQARAVCDQHQNTLVIARAGSGKTRVIVAKIAYLMVKQSVKPDEIAVFMFNRTAAAEVNQRIAAVCVDGEPLFDTAPRIASTFHKFALDITKAYHDHLSIISEMEHADLVEQALDLALLKLKPKVSSKERRELLSLTSNFIGRAGQKYPGSSGSLRLQRDIEQYLQSRDPSDARDHQRIFWHQVALLSYRQYLATLKFSRVDFNLLMARATDILRQASLSANTQVTQKSAEFCYGSANHISNLRHIMIDEYQDFSFLFFDLTSAIRELAPSSKLFVVGDDWQAINRFAGSDVDYFINFAQYFPQDQITIPLATNYRSDRRIVEHANHFMLTQYDSQALPAVAHSKRPGKIHTVHPQKVRFRSDDAAEDGLGDGRFLLELPNPSAARLLKTVVRIVKHHRHASIMLLHRHNFMSFEGISLADFFQSIRSVVLSEQIMSESEFDAQVRCMTMHKSKGLESDVVILLELDQKIVRSSHPHATIFELFGDNLSAETADQQRLLYVAMTRAKHQLYLLTGDREPPV